MEVNQLFSGLLLIFLANFVAGEFTAEDCKSLGFNKAIVLCSTCGEFSDSELGEIRDHCRECCVKDDDTQSNRSPRAVLEVCTCKFGAFPQIQAFIKSNRPKKYKNLQIKYVRGLDPVIKLYDADGKVKDVLDIHKWDTNEVDEFLQTHLLLD